jgi:hypothetical protein
VTQRVSWVAAAISEPAARARVRIWSGGESIVALAPAAGSGSSNATIVLPTGLDGGLGARLYVNASVVLENCYSSTVSDTMPPVDPNVGAFVELAVLEFLENGPMQTVVARCAQDEAAIATPIKTAHASRRLRCRPLFFKAISAVEMGCNISLQSISLEWITSCRYGAGITTSVISFHLNISSRSLSTTCPPYICIYVWYRVYIHHVPPCLCHITVPLHYTDLVCIRMRYVCKHMCANFVTSTVWTQTVAAGRDIAVVAFVSFVAQAPELTKSTLAIGISSTGVVRVEIVSDAGATDPNGFALSVIDVVASQGLSVSVSGSAIELSVQAITHPLWSTTDGRSNESVIDFRRLECNVSNGVRSTQLSVLLSVQCQGVGMVPNVWTTGSLCLPCPRGAQCFVNGDNAYAIPGYMSHGESDGSALFVACLPSSKCCGNNTCCGSLGYTGIDFACVVCAIGYYKLGGECRKCSAGGGIASVALFSGLVVAAVCALARIVARGVETSFVAITMNFAQTIAVVSSLHVPWPDNVSSTMSVLSVVNFNLDVIQPECTLPEFRWSSRYIAYMSFPLVVVGAACVGTYLGPAACCCCKRRHNSSSSSIGRGLQQLRTPQPSAVDATVTVPKQSGISAATRRASLTATMGEIARKALSKSQYDLAKLVVLSALKTLYLVICKQALSFFDCTRVGAARVHL